jgi:hypothetical protein
MSVRFRDTTPREIEAAMQADFDRRAELDLQLVDLLDDAVKVATDLTGSYEEAKRLIVVMVGSTPVRRPKP